MAKRGDASRLSPLRRPLAPSPSPTIPNDHLPSHSMVSPRSPKEDIQVAEDGGDSQKQSSRAAEYILDVVRRKQPYYDRKYSSNAFFSASTSHNATASARRARPARTASASQATDKSDEAEFDALTVNPATASETGTPASDAGSLASLEAGCERKIRVGLDRGGLRRPANKRFLERDTNGDLKEGVSGPATQLEEIQNWIRDKKFTKFDLMPDPSEFTFEDIDQNVLTEPYWLRNQGRKLLLGKEGDIEVSAIMPVSPNKIFGCRFIQWNLKSNKYNSIHHIEQMRDAVDELFYPFQAFMHSTREDAWSQLQTVVGYVFLICGEAKATFTGSAKPPGYLSTALTYIKEVYAPNEKHPTAATVDRTIQKVEEEEEDSSDMSQLERINTLLDEKGVRENLEQVFSDPSIFVFRDFTPDEGFGAKGISNAHSRMLFIGEDEKVQTWAIPSRKPNKSICGWIINVDKETGRQSVPLGWSNLPSVLTFPFQVFREKGDALTWRRLIYTVGYMFLFFGEAEVAVRLGQSFLHHFISSSIPRAVKKLYGTASVPTTWPHVRKPGDFPGPDEASPSAIGTQKNTQDTQPLSLQYRSAPREDQGRDKDTVQHSIQQSPKTSRPAIDFPTPHATEKTYTAPAGEYRSTQHLAVATFLEATYPGTSKRPPPPTNDHEDRPTKYRRLQAERETATRLRLFQQREVDRIQQELEEEKMKLGLMQEAEMDYAGQMGGLTREMTDEEFEGLWEK